MHQARHRPCDSSQVTVVTAKDQMAGQTALVQMAGMGAMVRSYRKGKHNSGGGRHLTRTPVYQYQ